MKIAYDIGYCSFRNGGGFNPQNLFAGDVDGTLPDFTQAFTDTAGTTPTDWGQSIARVDDRSGNERNAVQASTALRPLLGREPIVPRRNRLRHTEDFNHPYWVKQRITLNNRGGGVFDVIAAAGGDGKALRSASSIFPDDPEDAVWSVDVQFINWPRVGLLGVNGALSSSNQTAAAFNIETGQVVGTGSGTTATITALPDGWYRITMRGGSDAFRRRWTLVMLNGEAATLSGNQAWTGTGAEKVRVRRPQFERAPSPTPYQRVGNALDVTEDGFPSPAFIRFDQADDVLSTAFPDGFTGDVMLFGVQGIWIERDVTISPAGSLNIGPTTITGGPAGLLDELGDLVGWVAVDRAITDAERDRLVKYHKPRGAGDLLEAI